MNKRGFCLSIALAQISCSWAWSQSSSPASREPLPAKTVVQLRGALSELTAKMQAARLAGSDLAVRHQANIDVRLWAIRQCLDHKVKPGQAQDLADRISTAIEDTSQILEQLTDGQDYFAKYRGRTTCSRTRCTYPNRTSRPKPGRCSFICTAAAGCAIRPGTPSIRPTAA